MKKKKKIIIAICIIAALLAVLYGVLVNILVSAALIPSFMERLEAFERITDESYAAQVQTSDIKVNRQLSINETNEWLEKAECQKISVETEDGYTLVAEEFLANEETIKSKKSFKNEETPKSEGSFIEEESFRNEASLKREEASANESNHRWVLILHGYTGWKEEMYPFAYWYHEEGYHVIVPDLRCQGESEGDFIGMGWTDHYDCALWISYILSQDSEAKIVVHGQSMGAATALMMTGEEDISQNIAAVVSDCAYTDAYSMFGEKVKEWFHLPAFPLIDSACIALQLRGGYNLKNASAINAVQRSNTPTLFIHGDADAMISVDMTKELYEAAACRKKLLIIEGAGHAQSQDKEPDTYYGTIETFLKEVIED